MFGILFLVTVAGMPSLKELPVKEFSPADVLSAETSLTTETYPAATGLLPSNKLFCISPIVTCGFCGARQGYGKSDMILGVR